MEQLLSFLYVYWFKILLGVLGIWMVSSFGRDWFKEQFEWFKNFFEEGPQGKSSSRRAIEVAVVWVFLLSYLRISLIKESLEDMPTVWGMMIAGILGLKTLDAYVKLKGGNNGNNNGDGENKPT